MIDYPIYSVDGTELFVAQIPADKNRSIWATNSAITWAIENKKSMYGALLRHVTLRDIEKRHPDAWQYLFGAKIDSALSVPDIYPLSLIHI